MKHIRLTRRQFFKLSALSASALTLPGMTLAAIAAPAPPEASAAAQQASHLAIPQPTFNAIASTTAFGSPTDLSAGWDGTLWAIDANGSPHLYDSTANQWNPHGDGLDGATNVNGVLYFFRGQEVLQLNANTGAPTLGTIGEVFPNLPDSFKLGVVGAANVGGTLVLFNGGRYVRADGAAPPQKLTDLPNWPKTTPWQDGLITNAFGDGTNLILMSGTANLTYLGALNNLQLNSTGTIDHIFDWGQTLPGSWLSSGFDAGFAYYIGPELHYALFKGTAVAQFVAGSLSRTTPTYIPIEFANWPATWHPRLQHAPSGRMGNLWASAVGGRVLQHDGDHWIETPGVGPSTSVGQDNSVYVIGANGGLFRWNGTTFDPQGSLAPLTQVSVGDAGHVWVRDGGNAVHRYTGNNTFTPVNLGANVLNPTHITANPDGTLWHCNSANANAHRFISEGTAPSATIPVKNGVVTGVQKVTSTSFGTAYSLVTQNGQSQPQLYRYDSPYVFKTATNYRVWPSSTSVFARGLGNLYLVDVLSDPNANELNVRFVALDLHTGQEVASYTPTINTNQYTGMVFDPVNELVYVGTAPDNKPNDSSTPGELIALDARTMAVKWTFRTPAGIDSTPALGGTLLCFGDRTAVVYCIDTKQAMAAAAQNQPIPAHWTFPIDTNGPTHRVSTPLFAGDQVIATMWDIDFDPKEGLSLFQTVSINASNGTGVPFGLDLPSDTVPRNEVDEFYILQPPILGHALFPGFPAPSRTLFVRAASKIVAYNLDNNQVNQSIEFTLPGGIITSGLIYDDGTRLGGLPANGTPPASTRLWFGDDQGNLWSLDNQLKPADHTPHQIQKNTKIVTAPVLYKDPQGGLTVLYGILDPGGTLPPSLYGYDPDNGNPASILTGVTSISMLSAEVINGVIYAGGTGLSIASGSLVQVFGIRVDKLPQLLRDFVIESQMMQDPDQNGSGNLTPGQPLPANPIPNSVARYQTHLTIVDDQKSPVPHESVKIWCDTPNTTIAVDGRTFTIGPNDAQFASVKTGIDGALVITRDATDYFAPTLRVWAGFMDPYERIVVNADTEFHQRVMTAHADPTDSNPAKVNLQTATNYKGTSLFTDDEKSQTPSAPQNVASSIQQMGKGLGLSNGTSKGMYRKLMRAMGVKHKNQRVQVQLIEAASAEADVTADATATEKYMAYADLPGAAHFPTNIPSTRLASIAQPVGLSFSRPGGDATKAPIFSALSHADARAAIDDLKGEAWKPTDPHGGNAAGNNAPGGFRPQHTFNIFQDFWNWLKGLLDKVLQCILSIAEDILAGIQYVVNGILKTFKAIIKVLEDVFPFLGSFFKMLEKLIDDAMAALSALFNFGEIIKTHQWLAHQMQSVLEQSKGVIKTQVTPAIDTFFKQGEDAIKTLFDGLRQKLSPGSGINSMQGATATPHTAFYARPGSAGPKSGGSSQAVQCTWITQTMKSQLPAASEPALSALAQPGSTGDDPLGTFVTNFVNRISGNGDLQQVFEQLKTDFGRLFHPTSAGDFLTTLLETLIDIIEAVLIGVLAVSNALIDGLLDQIDTLFDAVTGFLNDTIEIPIISWLYQQLFKENLTYLNLVTLVAAIPVTVLYRVVEGHYPSADGIQGPTQTATHGAQPHQQPASPTNEVIKKIQGVAGGIFALGLGIARAISDNSGAKPNPKALTCVLVFAVSYIFTFFPLIMVSNPTGLIWAAWGIGLSLALLGVFGLINLIASEAVKAVFQVALPLLRFGLGTARLVVFCIEFVQTGKTDATSDVALARNIFLEWPPILNPLRWLGETGALALAIVDGVTGVVVCGLDVYLAFVTSAANPSPYRWYMPWVASNSAAVP